MQVTGAKELAKKYKKNKKLVIAKFDVTGNDSPLEFDYSDFPASRWWRQEGGEV